MFFFNHTRRVVHFVYFVFERWVMLGNGARIWWDEPWFLWNGITLPLRKRLKAQQKAKKDSCFCSDTCVITDVFSPCFFSLSLVFFSKSDLGLDSGGPCRWFRLSQKKISPQSSRFSESRRANPSIVGLPINIYGCSLFGLTTLLVVQA